MKVTYEKQEINLKEEIKVSKLLEKEISENKYKVVGCIINNEYRNLDTTITKDCTIKLLDLSTKEGMNIYRRTLIFIMGKAFEKLYPNEKITVEYQLGDAMFCKCDNS